MTAAAALLSLYLATPTTPTHALKVSTTKTKTCPHPSQYLINGTCANCEVDHCNHYKHHPDKACFCDECALFPHYPENFWYLKPDKGTCVQDCGLEGCGTECDNVKNMCKNYI